MSTRIMKVLGFGSVAFLAASCQPKFPNCKTDDDCKSADANHGAVHCIDGQCQECKTDADCGTGKSCQSMRCVTASSATAPVVATPPPATADASNAASKVEPCDFPAVHFDFDSADLSPPARQALDLAAQCLQKKEKAKITVEGFCDERGTEEYNLALGERRAHAVEKYLEALGVHRLGTISYGKEKPLCTEEREECWKRNRRAEFEVSAR
jgi:peptidoglycan-associated lipoprotein